MNRRRVGYLNDTDVTLAGSYRPARKLSPAFTVGLFSPSEPIGGGRFDRMARNLKKLEQYGHSIVAAANYRAESAYTAGSIKQRVSDFDELLSRPDVDCLLSTWGGKQCNELLEYLDFAQVGRTRKPIISFSDGCVLLNAITAETGVTTFHGPNVAGKLDESEYGDLATFSGADMDKGARVFGPDVEWTIWRDGESEGRLFGGNLNTFALGLTGTKFLELQEPVIFFWESLGDRPQIIHQQLTLLVNCGWFDRVAGMIVGDLMTDPSPEGSEWKRIDVKEAVLNALIAFDLPILKCDSFGHRSLQNPVVPIGPKCRLKTQHQLVTLEEPALT